MSKTTTALANAKKETAVSTTAPADITAAVQRGLLQGEEIDMDAIFAAMSATPEEDLYKVAGDDYYKFTEGVVEEFICMGLAKDALPSKKDPGQKVDAVMMMTRDKMQVINADAVMVSTVRRMQEAADAQQKIAFPRPMRVMDKGAKKSAAGEYRDLSIWFY